MPDRENGADDFRRYSVENVLRQIPGTEAELGVYAVRFFAENGRPSRVPTGTVETFYYYPSGGTIRDAHRNIVFYEPRLDAYHARSSVR
jgi:hypothetical protein